MGCLADGRKLPSVCIFKLKNIPRENFPEGVIIRVNAKGWCNEEEMIYWINNVWSERSESGNPQSLLILDSFRGHTVDPVKHEFRRNNTHLAVIPGGLTSKLQSLDVGINKCFKEKVQCIKIFFVIHRVLYINRVLNGRCALVITSR